MGGIHNSVVGFIYTFCLFLSTPFLLAGYIMKMTTNCPCDPVIYKPLLLVGVFLFVLFLLGILGSCCGCALFMWLYLLMLGVMMLAVVFTMLFGATVMKGATGVEVPGRGYTEYKLTDFSSWLRSKLVDDEHWEEIRSCMIKNDICGKFHMLRSVVDMVAVNRTKWTTIKSGYCKPPIHCGFMYESSTQWKIPDNGIMSQDRDCKTWSNQEDELCYNCVSCKAGYLTLFLKY